MRFSSWIVVGALLESSIALADGIPIKRSDAVPAALGKLGAATHTNNKRGYPRCRPINDPYTTQSTTAAWTTESTTSTWTSTGTTSVSTTTTTTTESTTASTTESIPTTTPSIATTTPSIATTTPSIVTTTPSIIPTTTPSITTGAVTTTTTTTSAAEATPTCGTEGSTDSEITYYSTEASDSTFTGCQQYCDLKNSELNESDPNIVTFGFVPDVACACYTIPFSQMVDAAPGRGAWFANLSDVC